MELKDLQGNNCRVDGCTNKKCARGLCGKHYRRFRLYGDPNEITRNYQTGQTKHPLRSVYTNMLVRCNTITNEAYKHYGGRGIKVCDRWLGKDGFAHFIEDMGDRPDGTSLDRIDNDKGYMPENCRWATRTEQANNTRATQFITILGDEYPLSEACKMFNIKKLAVYKLKQGLPKYGYSRTLEEAFAQALLNKYKGGLTAWN